VAAAGETVRAAGAAEATRVAQVIRASFAEYRGVLEPPSGALAATAGRDRVRLGVRLVLPRNRAFFEALGYREVGLGSHPGMTVPTFAWLEKRIGSGL